MKSLTIIFLCLSCTAFSTSIDKKSLDTLVAESDHIIIGTVSTVRMYTWFGIETKNPKARTGPGGKNELRWTVTLDPSGVLFTKKEDVPEEITVRLWKMWHMDLESAKFHEGRTYVLLLKGEDMQWVYPGWFYRDLSELEEIKSLIQKIKDTKQYDAASSGRYLMFNQKKKRVIPA